MQRIMRITVIAIAPFVLVGGLMLATGGGVASGAPNSAAPTTSATPPPPGTPTGCPAPGYLCSYFYTGSGQGSSDICIKATGNVTAWASKIVSGKQCSANVGALVNTHTSGDVTLFAQNLGQGQESCIAYGSYYDNLNNNFYPNGYALIDYIGSSYVTGGTC